MASEVNETLLTLHIKNKGDEGNPEELDQLTHTLMRSIEEMNVGSVTLLQEGNYVPGAKGDLPTVGGLLISILPTALPKIMEFLQSWVMQSAGRTIRAKVQRGDRSAEIEYPANMSPDELKNHLDAIQQMIEE